jgi:hypothetical protein
MVPKNLPVFSHKTSTSSRTRSVITRSCTMWLFIFPELRSLLTGTHFHSTEDISNKMAELLKALSQNDFRKCFKAWKARLGRCVAFDGNYEGHLQSSWTHLITPSRNFVEVRWQSFFRSTSLGKRCPSYNAPPTSSWSLRNFLPRSSLFVVGKAQKSHGPRSELNSVFDLEKVDRWNPIRTSVIQPTSRPMRFLGFSNHEKGAPRQEISKWSTVCSTFSRSEWSVVRSASLAKGGTSKKRPSSHLYKVPTRSNKVSPRTFQTALVI